jgi:hypothetical protein
MTGSALIRDQPRFYFKPHTPVGRLLASAWSELRNPIRKCTGPEQHVMQPYYFETTEPKRRNGRFAKRVDRSAIQKQTEIENNRVAAARIQDLIKGLEGAVSSLNGSIGAVLEGVQVRDPSHFAYPIAARTMSARRDNIQATIAVLSAQLAKINNVQSAN